MTTTLTARNPRCSIARSLEVLGEKWTLLVVREAFFGRTRFAEFRERLGVAPDVLADRLATLVDIGVFARRPYREAGEREREEYVLTEEGRALLPVLGAFVQWGDEYRPTGYGPATQYTDARTGAAVRLAFVDPTGAEVALDDIAVVAGPGSLSAAEPVRP
jgi:DNA-binding HxlR family transcriptional regulator